MTITNTSGASLTVEHRFCVPRTVLAIGANVVLGVSMSDLVARGDITGYKASQYLDDLVKKGLATVAFAVDPNDTNVEDLANEV
jgi:hypothetical protein